MIGGWLTWRRLLVPAAAALAACSGTATPDLPVRQIATEALSETPAARTPGPTDELRASLQPPTLALQTASPAGPQPSSGQELEASMDDLDLRYANIVDVTVELLADGRYRFDVTLLHDDDGEAPEYADAWEVLDLEGSLLGRRVLLHAHSTAPFTRSDTLDIPAGLAEVIVRGRDMRHGYGGQALRVDLESGELEAIKSPTADPDNGT